MLNNNGIENLPENLLNKLPKPKKGRPIIYEVLAGYQHKELGWVYPTSVQVPNTDSVYINNKGDVSISYVKSRVPAPIESNREYIDKLGDIFFRRNSAGKIIITEQNYAKYHQLHAYLWFSNFNESNKDKPYHKKPQSYLYRVANINQEHIDKKKEVDKYLSELVGISKLHHSKKRELGYVLLSNYLMIEDDMTVLTGSLYAYAESHPEEVKELLEDEERVKVYKFIKALEEKSLLKLNEKRGGYVKANGQLSIPISNYKQPKQEAYKYFQTDQGISKMGQLKKELEGTL